MRCNVATDAISSLGIFPRQEKQQPAATEPAPASEPAQEPSSTTQESSSSEPTPSSSTATNPAPGAAQNSSGGMEIQAMPERLRDLIANQQTSRTDTPLTLFTRKLAATRAERPAQASEPVAVQQTAQEIMAKAAASLVAQANHTRDSALALLQTE